MKKPLKKISAIILALAVWWPCISCARPAFSFATDIVEGAVVSDNVYTFKAAAYCGNSSCSLAASCNGVLLSLGENGFTAYLDGGVNIIELTAKAGNREQSRAFTVNYRAEFSIETDIDKAIIVDDGLSFAATALFNDKSCALAVLYGDNKLAPENGKYRVRLKKGENKFTFIAAAAGLRKSYEWTVCYQGFVIITDLAAGDTVEDTLVFRAGAQYGDEGCGLAVTRNGQEITPDGNVYRIALQEGENEIKLRASAAKAVKTLVYRVRFSDSPPSLATSIIDDRVYKGSIYNFDVVAKDGLERKIEGANISFAADWTAGDGIESFAPLSRGDIAMVWDDSSKTSFRIDFKKGAFALQGAQPFILRIMAADPFGKLVSLDYTMTYAQVGAGEKIGEVVFALEGFSIGCGYFIAPCYVEVKEGVPFSRTLIDIITAHGWTYKITGTVDSSFYLAAIDGLDLSDNMIPEALWRHVAGMGYKRSLDQNASLGEFDYGSGSGWMYSVNGIYKNYGFADYYPQDGDVVRVQFTLLLGEDLGGGGAMGGGSGGSILGDNPDYAPLMRLLALIGRDATDKKVYREVLEAVSVWDIANSVMEAQLSKLREAYGSIL